MSPFPKESLVAAWLLWNAVVASWYSCSYGSRSVLDRAARHLSMATNDIRVLPPGSAALFRGVVAGEGCRLFCLWANVGKDAGPCGIQTALASVYSCF